MAYENKRNWTLGQNKPNTNPTKPNSKPIKANSNPKQTQSKPIFGKTAKKFLWFLPSAITMLLRKFNKPGERKIEYSARPKLRTDPMNLLGTMPAKEG